MTYVWGSERPPDEYHEMLVRERAAANKFYEVFGNKIKGEKMKASELVTKLNALIAHDGDLPVVVSVSDGEGGHGDAPCSNIVICAGDDGKPKSFLIADRETEIAFT